MKKYDVKMAVEIERLINRNKREIALLYHLNKQNEAKYYIDINKHLSDAFKLAELKIYEGNNG